MEIGEFWTAITLLCALFDGRVTSGPRSLYWNKEIGGAPNSFHPLGKGADVVLRDAAAIDPFLKAAERMKITVIKETDHLHCQPA